MKESEEIIKQSRRVDDSPHEDEFKDDESDEQNDDGDEDSEEEEESQSEDHCQDDWKDIGETEGHVTNRVLANNNVYASMDRGPPLKN